MRFTICGDDGGDADSAGGPNANARLKADHNSRILVERSHPRCTPCEGRVRADSSDGAR